MRREILPNRPLRLSRRYRNNRLAVILIFGIAAALFLIAFGIFAIRDLRGYAREERVWNRGMTCTDADYQLMLGEDTELAIRCRDADGKDHHGTLTLYSMLYSDVTRGEVEIRYDPDDPDEFAISSGIALIEQRRGATYGGMISIGIFVLVLGGFALLFWRRLAIARRLARTGDEIIVDITRVQPKMRGKIETHMRKVFWKHPDGLRICKTNLDAKAGLAWINSHEHKALALRSGKHVILLAGTLAPLDLDAEVDGPQVLARLEQNGGGLPRGLPELADWIVYSPPASK